MLLHRLLSKNGTQFRLISDHYQLILEFFCLKNKAWTHFAKTECERLNEMTLTSWLKSSIQNKQGAIELLLADDAFQFLELDAPLTASEQSPEFISEISNTLSLETEMLLLDAFYQDQKLRVLILNKASVMPYLQAFKTCKMILQRVAPVSLPNTNLLPWREKKAAYIKWLRRFKLILFPVIALTLLFFTQEWTGTKLQKLKLQNQRFSAQLESFQSDESSIPLKIALPLIQQILQKSDGLNVLQINPQGELNLSGLSQQQQQLHSMLKDFSILPQIEPNSMRNWALIQNEAGAVWSVTYQLKQAAS